MLLGFLLRPFEDETAIPLANEQCLGFLCYSNTKEMDLCMAVMI